MSDPTIGLQFDSDEQAQIYLKQTLQGSFILRPLTPDFFLDYQAEQRRGGEPAGEPVFIQLKGQLRLRQVGGFGKVQVKAKALRYYKSTAQDPVFIVLVDVSNKRGFYLFAQRWLDAEGSSLSLEGDRKITVAVPLSNDLSDLPRFIMDCRLARDYMREKYPGSPEAALAKYVDGYAKLDPRFLVRASVGPRGKMLEVAAKQPAIIALNIFGASVESIQAIGDSTNYGKAFSMTSVRIKAEGSPLFEKLMDGQTELKVEWQPATAVDCQVEFGCDGGDAPFTLTLPARLTRGRHGFALRTTSDDCPIHYEDTIRASAPHDEPRPRLTVDTRTWTGKTIRFLPWYSGVIGFIGAARQGRPMYVALVLKGNAEKFGVLTNVLAEEAARGIMDWFYSVLAVRSLAEALGLDGVLPDFEKLSHFEFESTIRAYDLLKKGELRTSGLTATACRQENLMFWAEAIPLIKKHGDTTYRFKFTVPHTFRFLGRDASLGELRTDGFIGKVRLVNPSADLSKESVDIEVTPLEGEDITFRLVRK